MNHKEKLYNHCHSLLSERVEQAQLAMNASQEDANSESKGSAGDKHETGRAMAHLEKEVHTRRHAMALSSLYKLQSIRLSDPTEVTAIGSLVTTNIGIYFIAVGLGSIQMEDQTYKVISADSPMGQTLLELEEDDEVFFRNTQMIILLIE